MKMKLLPFALLLVTGCAPASQPHITPESEFTLGIVQREIHSGMSQAQVAEALGSPNIVSRDEGGHEAWIYDKIATEASYKNTNSGAGFLGGVGGVAGSVLLLGIPSVYFDQKSGTQTTTQKTLTVVIKFDGKNLVDTATYHMSKF